MFISILILYIQIFFSFNSYMYLKSKFDFQTFLGIVFLKNQHDY